MPPSPNRLTVRALPHSKITIYLRPSPAPDHVPDAPDGGAPPLSDAPPAATAEQLFVVLAVAPVLLVLLQLLLLVDLTQSVPAVVLVVGVVIVIRGVRFGRLIGSSWIC